MHTAPGRLDSLLVGASSAETTDEGAGDLHPPPAPPDPGGRRPRFRHPDAGAAPGDRRRDSQDHVLLLMGVATICLLVGHEDCERRRSGLARSAPDVHRRPRARHPAPVPGEAVVLSLLGIMGAPWGRGDDGARLRAAVTPSLGVDSPRGRDAGIGLFFGYLPARRAAKLDRFLRSAAGGVMKAILVGIRIALLFIRRKRSAPPSPSSGSASPPSSR